MINTYQTSLAPPPVPPRLGRSQPFLIPAPLPSPGHTKPLIRFLVGVVVLNLLLSAGAFIYLYYNDKMEIQKRHPEAKAGAAAAFHSAENQEASSKALARMVVKQRSHTAARTLSGYLQWDMGHSNRRNINYYEYSWLTILQPGDYYVYSRVTFSKGDSVRPLTSRVKLRRNETGEEKVVMQAFCSLDTSSGSAAIPRPCTATQGEVLTLEKGNQLSVWVQDLSLVDYEEGATSFGMYRV